MGRGSRSRRKRRENGVDKSIPNVWPFDITCPPSGIPILPIEESGSELFQSWRLRRGGGRARGGKEQNALKMEKRLRERSKRDRGEKLMLRVAL